MNQYTYAPLAVKYYYSGSKSGYLRIALFNIIIGVLFLLSTAFISHPFSTNNLLIFILNTLLYLGFHIYMLNVMVFDNYHQSIHPLSNLLYQ